MADTQRGVDAIQTLRHDFRQQLETFYGRLKLAPPYHSVEKAITTLTSSLTAMTPDGRARVMADRSLRWAEYQKAFVQSGLHLKHRGIIVGLVRSNQIEGLPPEYENFLQAYRSDEASTPRDR